MQGIAQKILAEPGKYSVQQLTQAIQAGVLPAYIGVPIIQDKVQQQKQAQMGQQAQSAQPNQPSVVQQVMSEAQGLQALPTNLPQNYAGGGIVAFENGGEVERYQNKGYVYETPYDRMNRENRERGLQFGMNAPTDEQALADREAMMDTVRKMGAAGMDIATLPGRGILGAAETAITRPLRALGVPIPYLPDSVYGGNRASMTPYYDKLRAKDTAAQPAPTPTATPAIAAESAPPAEAPPQRNVGAGGAGAGAPGGGIASLMPAPKQDIVGDTRNLIEGFNTRDDARIAQRDALIKEAEGKVTGKAYQGLEASLRKEAEQFGADKEQAKGMAIFKAGLAMMAGTSRHALENIGKGAMVGAEDYQAAAKDLKKAQKENERAMAMVEQARRAEDIGDRDRATTLAYKAEESAAKRDQFGTSAIINATGKSAEFSQDAWKAILGAQTHLGVANIGAAATKYAADARGSRGMEITPSAMAGIRMKAMKMVDEGEVRSAVAKQLGLGKVPPAGKDATFDSKVGAAYESAVNRYIAQAMGSGTPGGAQNNPFAGYRIVSSGGE